MYSKTIKTIILMLMGSFRKIKIKEENGKMKKSEKKERGKRKRDKESKNGKEVRYKSRFQNRKYVCLIPSYLTGNSFNCYMVVRVKKWNVVFKVFFSVKIRVVSTCWCPVVVPSVVHHDGQLRPRQRRQLWPCEHRQRERQVGRLCAGHDARQAEQHRPNVHRGAYSAG